MLLDRGTCDNQPIVLTLLGIPLFLAQKASTICDLSALYAGSRSREGLLRIKVARIGGHCSIHKLSHHNTVYETLCPFYL